MTDSSKEDELRDPLAADRVDLSESPIILHTMVWIFILEPQAEFELCLLSLCIY